MTTPSSFSRRRALQLLTGAPLLPIASASPLFIALSACGGDGSNSNASTATVKSASFQAMPAPTLANPAAMATTTVGSSMSVNYSDGTSRTFALQYEPFFITGSAVQSSNGGTIIAGSYFDINNQPIKDASAPGNPQFFSDAPDGMSLLKLASPTVAGIKGNTVFAVVQFEYTTKDAGGASKYGQLPSPIAVLTLDQDKATGKLTLVKYHNVDTSGVNGLWITCGASLSPWNTHLSSEEYPPDAFVASNAQLASFSTALYGNPNTANPYHYGHTPEVTVNPDGTGSIKKHYGMGRISHELVAVLPDERTVLMGDDTTNGGAFMFIADKARDLSAGSLYVGKWNQTSSTGPGAATLSWIKLGSANSADIKKLVDSGIKPADIMEVKTADPGDASFMKIPFGGRFNWIKIKPGMEQAACFLETHRYAALKGGSLGFTKWEGTTVNTKDRIAYIAMSRIESSMLNGSGDVKVEGPYSGAVYAQQLRGGQKDSAGVRIDSDWVPVDMAAVPALIAEDLGGGKFKAQDALGNFANPDRIATPDNLKYSERLRTLFIGEDSNTHVNNFLWAYNVDDKSLKRILSTPAGAESTGLHAADEMNGFTYIMSNFQHAGDWESPLHDVVKPKLDPIINANYKNGYGAAVGYITGMPQLA